MILKDHEQLRLALQRLAELETRLADVRAGSISDPHVREVTVKSLGRVIKQLKEDVSRFRAAHVA